MEAERECHKYQSIQSSQTEPSNQPNVYMALYDSCDSTELSGELNENRHHQIYNTTCDEMSIEKIPKGAPDSNGLDQYDYADMSAGDSTSGTSQLQIASLSQEEHYAILNPNVTGFHRNFTVRNKTRPEQYEFAMPTSNISEIAVHLDVPEGHYMVSNEVVTTMPKKTGVYVILK